MNTFLVFQIAIISLHVFLTFSLSINTTARKKLGKKSFIEKQERGQLQEIPTSNDLLNLAIKNSAKTLGSSYYLKGWRHWRTLAIESIRSDLSENLPHPADKAKFENLFFRLGVAADQGEMPSFSDAGARSGYALEFFCRARNLADLFTMDTFNPRYSLSKEWVDAMLKTPMLGGKKLPDDDMEEFRMVSLGGGPGFDFVGAALAAYFNTIGKTNDDDMLPIHATILDYEEGWGDLVEAMNESTNHILQNGKFNSEWGGKCDITKSMSDPSNHACLAKVHSTQLWTCQYCVAENANLLRQSNFVFFRDLFDLAPTGTLFIFTETTPRIWPDLCRVIEKDCTSKLQVGFSKSGRQILLRKDPACENMMMNEYHFEQLQEFQRIVECHEKKISSGYERQQQKVRGSKKID